MAFYKHFGPGFRGLIIGFCCIRIPSAAAGFNFQTYQNNNSPNFLFVDSTRSDEDIALNPVLNSVVYQYFHNPIGYNQGSDGSGALVPSLQGLNLVGEYNPWKRTSLGLELAVDQLHYYKKGDAFTLGDTRLFSKMVLSREAWGRELSLSLTPSLYLPTGNGRLLLSNSHGGAGGTLIAEKKVKALKLAANLGAAYFPGAEFNNVSYAAQLYAGLGAALDLSPRWGMQIEWTGRQVLGLRMGDLFAGGQYHISSEQDVIAGASLASTSINKESLEYRLMAALRWSPSLTKVIVQHTQTKIETIQKFKTTTDCGPKPYAARFQARALSEKEKNRLRAEHLLPYISSPTHKFGMARLGTKTGTNAQGLAYVKDTQIIFAVDLPNLPPRETVISIKTLELSMNVNKLWNPGEEKTDMICLLDEKICSGDQYGAPSMAANINFNFFKGKEPPNDFFMRQISTAAEGTPRGFPAVSTARLKLPLAKLLENSVLSELMDLIYESLENPPPGRFKTLYFAVAHDLYVANVHLELELSAQSCTQTNSQPTVERHQEESTSDGEPRHD